MTNALQTKNSFLRNSGQHLRAKQAMTSANILIAPTKRNQLSWQALKTRSQTINTLEFWRSCFPFLLTRMLKRLTRTRSRMLVCISFDFCKVDY
jgi:hypothetical protein